jgi:uroporphyrinogen decarboxylase
MVVQFPAWFSTEQKPDGDWDITDKGGTRIATMPFGATFFNQNYFPYLDGYPPDYKD